MAFRSLSSASLAASRASISSSWASSLATWASSSSTWAWATATSNVIRTTCVFTAVRSALISASDDFVLASSRLSDAWLLARAATAGFCCAIWVSIACCFAIASARSSARTTGAGDATKRPPRTEVSSRARIGPRPACRRGWVQPLASVIERRIERRRHRANDLHTCWGALGFRSPGDRRSPLGTTQERHFRLPGSYATVSSRGPDDGPGVAGAIRRGGSGGRVGQHRPEGAGDEERPIWDVALEGDPGRGHEEHDGHRGGARPGEEGRHEPGRPDDQPDAQEQLEVADPDRPGPERDGDDEERGRQGHARDRRPEEGGGRPDVRTDPGHEPDDRVAHEGQRHDVRQEALVEVRGEKENEEDDHDAHEDEPARIVP